MRRCCRIVTGQCLELVLITVNEQRNIPEIGRKILYLGAIDQLLPLKHTTQQEADNYQYDGDFDEGEATLVVFHVILQLNPYGLT